MLLILYRTPKGICYAFSSYRQSTALEHFASGTCHISAVAKNLFVSVTRGAW